MSRQADCYDNATMEAFWSRLKNELVHRRQFRTRAEATTAIFDYIGTSIIVAACTPRSVIKARSTTSPTSTNRQRNNPEEYAARTRYNFGWHCRWRSHNSGRPAGRVLSPSPDVGRIGANS